MNKQVQGHVQSVEEVPRTVSDFTQKVTHTRIATNFLNSQALEPDDELPASPTIPTAKPAVEVLDASHQSQPHTLGAQSTSSAGFLKYLKKESFTLQPTKTISDDPVDPVLLSPSLSPSPTPSPILKNRYATNTLNSSSDDLVNIRPTTQESNNFEEPGEKSLELTAPSVRLTEGRRTASLDHNTAQESIAKGQETQIVYEGHVNESMKDFIEQEMIICENLSESKFESPGIQHVSATKELKLFDSSNRDPNTTMNHETK